MLHSYFDYNKKPEEELITSWKEEIKPFCQKKYPLQQAGIFNENADIIYMISSIDKFIKKSKKKLLSKSVKRGINKSLEFASPSPLMNNFKLENEQEYENVMESVPTIDEEKLANDDNNNRDTKFNDIQPLESGEIIISDFNENYSVDDIDMKKTKTMPRNDHSTTIGSKSTAVSIYDQVSSKYSNLRSSAETVSFMKEKGKEITPVFSDEFDTEGFTIIHKKNVITQMTFNLFLKKIVIGKFYDDYLDYTINFAEQCFHFLKREIVFKKIFSCYEFYTNLQVPFTQRKKLLDFMNYLVIKMYKCFTKIEENEEVISIIKKFYNNLINELSQIVQKRKGPSENNEIKTDLKDNNNNNKNEEKIEEKPEDIKEKISSMLERKHVIKEEKEVKIIIENKEEKKEEKEIAIEKELSPEEEVIEQCKNVLSLFKFAVPKPEILSKIEESLNFFKLKTEYKNNKAINDHKNFLRKKKKSQTEKTVSAYALEENYPRVIPKKMNYFSCLNYEIRDLAEELIHISHLSLIKIKTKELYNGAFLKKSKFISSPNIIENINKFNKLIFFIIEEILSYDFPKDRARIIERWAMIADYCIKRRDYNDVFAINSVFKNYIVSGLFLTWKEIGNKAKKIITQIDNLCSIEGNYRNVREDMKSLNNNEFYTPYMGLLLKDLNFYEENYKYIVNGNFINFEKINGVQGAIDEFFYFKHIADKKRFRQLDDLRFFEELENQKESYLEELANKLEPKFILSPKPQKTKRLTEIDKKYFNIQWDDCEIEGCRTRTVV